MKKVILVSILATALFTSCKKDSNNNNCSNTTANLAGTYSIVKIEIGSGGNYQDVTTSYLDACQLDDKLILNTNGTLTYTDAGTKCDPDDSDTGTWSLGSDGKLTVSGGSVDASNAEIVSFDCTTLVIKDSQSSGGISLDGRITLRK